MVNKEWFVLILNFLHILEYLETLNTRGKFLRNFASVLQAGGVSGIERWNVEWFSEKIVSWKLLVAELTVR